MVMKEEFKPYREKLNLKTDGFTSKETRLG